MTRKMMDSGVEWIGMIPDGWNTFSAFQIFSRVDCKNVGVKERNLLSLSYGRIKRKDIESADGLLPESFEGYNIIEAGDIVLRLTDLQNDQKSLRVGYSRERGIVTSAYLTIRNNSDNVPEYLYYYWHTFDICKGFYGLGAGVRQGLNWEGLKNLRIALPLPSVQNKIVELLNKQCATIDDVIAKTTESIEEYKKLRQAVITEAVTKGVRGKRSMKDSGNEWIGLIPDGWKRVKLSRLAKRIGDGLHGTPVFDDKGEFFFINGNNLGKERIEIKDNTKLVSASVATLYHIPLTLNTILISLNGTIGSISFYNNEQIILGKSAGYILLNDDVDKRYVAYYLQCNPVKVIYALSLAGTTIPNLSLETLRSTPVVLPDDKEQQEIVKYLDSKCAAIDSLISKKQQFIDELTAYKKSLIYEYVTGKKEVPA